MTAGKDEVAADDIAISGFVIEGRATRLPCGEKDTEVDGRE